MTDYPKREPFFAHKLFRRMGHVCAALEIGVDACWLVAIIAHTEDAARYNGPVGWWNNRLQDIAGFGSWDTLNRARKRAVAAGWLHYEAGGKGKIGKYWTMIPARYADIPDGPLHDDVAVIPRTGAEVSAEVSADTNLIQTGEKPGTSCDHSSLPFTLTLTDQKTPDHLHSDFTDDEKNRALTLVREHFTPPLFPSQMNADEKATLLRIALLRLTDQIPEGAVASALEGMKLRKGKPIKKPVAYLVKTIANEPTMKGRDFRAMLKGVEVPLELLAAWKDFT